MEEEEDAKKTHSSSSTTVVCKFELPKELPSVEETLKTLAAALKSFETSGLEKNDVLRLRCIIAGAKVYKELLSDYINYRGIEDELLELKEKYLELSKKPMAFRPNKLFEERSLLREQALAIESERLSKVETLKLDPLEFFRQVLGVKPTDRSEVCC